MTDRVPPPFNSTEGHNNEEAAGARSKRLIWLGLFLLCVLAGISFLAYRMNFFKVFLCRQAILDFLESLGPLAFAGFIVLQAAQVVFAPIPGELTGLMGGYLYGPVLGVALSTVGLVLGSFVAFCLSRTFGRPFIERFIDQSTLNRFDYLLHHKGLFLVFVLFLIPGFPKDYLCFILGLGHLSVFEFLAVSSVGRLFGTILLTLGGGYLRDQQYGRLSVLVGVAAILAFLVYVYRGRLERCFQMWHAEHRCPKTLDRSKTSLS